MIYMLIYIDDSSDHIGTFDQCGIVATFVRIYLAYMPWLATSVSALQLHY